MALFESDLVADLKSRPALAAIVGGRIYPGRVPESAPRDQARLVYQLVSRPRDLHLDGAALVARPRVQLATYSQSYADCAAVEEVLRLAYHGYSGPIGGYRVVSKVVGPVDLPPEDPADASDRAMFHRSVDVVFRLAEAPAPPALTVWAWWPGPGASSAWWPGPSTSP